RWSAFSARLPRRDQFPERTYLLAQGTPAGRRDQEEPMGLQIVPLVRRDRKFHHQMAQTPLMSLARVTFDRVVSSRPVRCHALRNETSSKPVHSPSQTGI